MVRNKEVFNPYLPLYEYVPDGEPHVFGDRVYVYGSHDRFNGDDFCLNDYVCWSAPVRDLTAWRYEGVIYRKEQDPIIPDAKKGRIFAPDCTRGSDGRYYLYYAFDFNGTIAVAVCDEPAGKYEYYGRVHYEDGTFLGEAEGDKFQYDPGVLVDDDGRVFLYTGFSPVGDFRKRFTQIRQELPTGGMVTELASDMLTVKRAPIEIVPNADRASGTSYDGHAFFEAPSIRKFAGKYYFIYSSVNFHELCYAVSERPDAGYSYGGVLVSNGDIGYQGRVEPLNYTGTNHGSFEKIGDAFYVFYHRQTNGNPYSRQGCAEQLAIGKDGMIRQAAVTSCGLNGGSLSGEGIYPAVIACALMSAQGAAPYRPKTQIGEEHPFFTQEGEDREEDPESFITNMRDGACAGYRYFRVKGKRSLRLLVRGTGTGTIKVTAKKMQSDTEGALFAGEVKVKPASAWTWFEGKIALESEGAEIWLRFEGTGAAEIKCLEFV